MDALCEAAATVSLQGALDITASEALKRELLPLETADRAVIDLSRVTYAGTTLLNALLALRKSMKQHGARGGIRLVGASPHVRRLLTITNLDRVFEVA